ncbi:MAG: trigger factor [Bacteroidales bacterium]|nr:trigger factor [Bacteroidales bacterium]MBQ5481426.1 trigger factor [Bacteroidales bacterium]
MKVTKNQVDDLNMNVTIALDKNDWAEPRKKKLNEFRRTADIRGFRRGMAPMGLIEKLHGGQALAEAVNTLVTDALNGFIEENKLNVLGEPLPSEKQSDNNWDNPDVFTFDFDLAVAPELNLTVTADDKIPYYTVTVTKAALEDYRHGLLKQFGQLESGEAAKEDDFVIADFVSGDQKIEGSYVSLRSMADDVKKEFVGLKKGDTRPVDIVKSFPNEADRAAMFHVKKEELETLPTEWTMTVNDVKTFVDAPLTQKTFDQIFGEGACKDEAEFDAKVKERLQEEYARESDYRFMIDAKEYLIDKAAIQLPDAFMKRWIKFANDDKFTMEQIEAEYDLFAKDFRWNMIRTKIMKDNDLKVGKDEVMKQAMSMAAYQFAMYGMNNVPEEHLTKYAEQLLADRQQAERIVEKVEDDMALTWVRKTATLEKKKISLEKMRELTK